MTETIFKSIVEYSCNEGFTLSGSHNRTCQADGTWSGADTVCVVPPNSNTSIQPGPVAGEAVAGFVVVALVVLAIIFGIVHVIKRKRRKHSTDDLQSNASNQQKSGQGAGTLTHFQDTEINVETSRNEAYITSAETFYEEADITGVATSLNKAYGAHQSTYDSGDYVINSLSDGENNDEPGMEIYDYVRDEYPQTRT